jgi:hypothetical protein
MEINDDLTTQREALALLPGVIEYARQHGAQTSTGVRLQSFLLDSSVYKLMPKDSSQRYDLLLVLAASLDKTLNEIAQLYLVGPSAALLSNTWLQAEQLLQAKQQEQDLNFLYALVMGFYQQLVEENSNLPLPYTAQPFAIFSGS